MALSLLSKPMAVTFPALLLVLDWWPLGRWPQISWRRLALEKLPLLALSIAHSAITLGSQRSVGADEFGARLTLVTRVANAAVSYVRYLGKAVWPDSLSVFYAHPGSWPGAVVLGAALLLAAITWLAWRLRKTRPWFVSGWLWYLGTLVPVIGLVQVGAQAMADRYSYEPLLGIFVAVVWTAAEVFGQTRRSRIGLGVVLSAILTACAAVTGRQVAAWTTSTRLYERSIAAGGDNATLRYLLAMAHARTGQPVAVVVAELQRAVGLDPGYTNALTQLAFIEFRAGGFEAAEAGLRRVISLSPRRAAPHKSLGAFFMHRGRMAEAETELRTALQIDPHHLESHLALATVLLARQQTREAHTHLLTAAGVDPWNPEAQCELGIVCALLQRFREARTHLERALWINPAYPRARENLAMVVELERKAGKAQP
jgi:Flp pilus assembly protein TadD